MLPKHVSVIASTTILFGVSSCSTPDSVGPGYYGETTVEEADSKPTAVRPAAGSGGPAGGKAEAPRVADTSEAPAQTEPTPSMAAGACDLSGRWLLTTHTTTDALGQLQYAHYYFYFEIAQQGDAFELRKALMCGTDAVGGGSFAVNADFSSSCAATRQKLTLTGLRGTSTASSQGCDFELEKFYMVMGATVPYYLDPANPLPSAEDMANGATPGWEDWDEDGNPGITGVISGVINGKVFTAPRNWLHLSGAVRDVRSTFELPVDWNAEPNVMAVDGSPLLSSEAVRAADSTLHFAEFARLETDQATGDDASICDDILRLAPTLTARAAGM